MEWKFVYWYGYTFWVYEFNGLARTWAVVLWFLGWIVKTTNSWLACTKRQIGQESLCIIQEERLQSGSHSLDLACWHALFGPSLVWPTVFLRATDLYAKRNLQEKLLFPTLLWKIWQHWAHIPMWQQFAAVSQRWGRCISVFYGFITFYSNYFHWLH